MDIKEIDFIHSMDRIDAKYDSEIPFDVKRVYFIYGVKDAESRGAHAHKKLDQVFFMIKGSCTMVLDDGRNIREVRMKNCDKALLVNHLVWHEMKDFSEDAVFVALASAQYDEADYIRNYQQFLQYIGDNNL